MSDSSDYPKIPHRGQHFSDADSLQRARKYYRYLKQRRSIRHFSDRPVSRAIVHNLVMAASSAPSGAHKQPWTFCAVSDPDIKKEIRIAAEKEEYESYNKRMTEQWKRDLAPLGTDWNKPFLEVAPWLIIVFKKAYDIVDGEKRKNYYVNESVGLASGFLISAIHHAGLVTLTHTPSPMAFLQKILNRPENERPFLLLPIGYPAKDAEVPDLIRKTEEDVLVWY